MNDRFTLPSFRRYRPQALLLVMAGLLLVVAWANRPQRLAAQDEQPDIPPAPSEATARAWAMLADRPGPQALEAQTFTPCVGGFAGIYPCNNVDLVAFVPLSTMSAGSSNDIWGWTDPLTGIEYGMIGLDNGTGFFELSDPENPIYLGKLPTHTSSSTWRDIKVYEDHAFVVSEAAGHGLQVFDLTELRNVPAPPVTFAETTHYNQFGNAHNLAINEDTGYAYAVGSGTCSGGLHMVNIQNPTGPTNAGCFSTDGYTHDTQCVVYNGPDTDHTGDEICFSSNEDTVTIVDVTDKANPVQLSRVGYTGSAYTHQGWLTEDQVYFLQDDELDESTFGHNTRTRIWDVSDLDSAVLLDFYDGPVSSIDHNLYILDGYAYESNYRSGLRILDLFDVANGNLSEIAFFDTYPSADGVSFDGTWSNYPYYDSGIVVVSGIDEGFFVLDPILSPDFRLGVSETDLAVCAPDDAATTIDLAAQNAYVGTVTLSALGLPAGTTAAFTVNPVVVPGSSDLTLTVGSTTHGDYTVTVEGTDGSITHAEDINLSVDTAVPAAPTLTAPADGATNVSNRPVFTWADGGQGRTYTIEIATDAAFTNIVDSATGLTEVTYTAGVDLDYEQTYYWRVSADNFCGEGGTSATFSFVVEPAPGSCGQGYAPNELYSIDFEAGASGWSSSGTGNSWALWDDRAFSGTMAYHADAPGSLSDQKLRSPSITLPAGEGPLSLSFWHYQDIRGSAGGTVCYDAAILEISMDNGVTWTQLESELLTDPYDGTVSTSYNNPLAGRNAWCGNPQDWTESIVDLDTYAGESVQFRFRLGTDDLLSSEGWTIDDVQVQSCQPPSAAVAASGDASAAGARGEQVLYTVAVTNTGDVADTYTIAFSGNEWDVSSEPAGPFTLVPGASQVVEVYVTVGEGASDTVTVTFASLTYPDVSASVNLTTSTWLTFLPYTSKP